MDNFDRDILNIIQSNLPVTERPWAEVGEEVGLSEAEVIERVERMKEAGIIRRIGGNVNSRSVGYASTLCAANVPAERFDKFVAAVNANPGVTHNYRRDNEDFNVWFTMIAPSRAELDAHLAAIEAETGVAVLSLPAVRTYKIKVDFEM